jgi:hypothetical protein
MNDLSMRRVDRGQATSIQGGVVGGAGVGDPIGDLKRDQSYGVKGVGQRLLIPRARPWGPCR